MPFCYMGAWMRNRFGITFSEHFEIDPEWLKAKGVFDPTLDLDSPLFIDPFLLHYSKHDEFKNCASEAYVGRFTQICNLLSVSKKEKDKAWRSALELFRTGEVRGLGGTCLGYSKSSTRGRGIGPKLAVRCLDWAKEVVDLGVKDPELFSSLSLFEDGIGADRISDMVASVTAECILAFNARIINEIKSEQRSDLPTSKTRVAGCDCELIINPFSGDPLLLLPNDVLKHLPIMDSAFDLKDIAESNSEIRGRVNQHIGEIFKVRTKQDKDAIKHRAMENAGAFQALLDLLKLLEKHPYDMASDPQGLLQWKANADRFTGLYHLKIVDDPKLPEIDRIDNVVRAIIAQFKNLVEKNRLNRTFFVDGKPRHERYAQLLFLAIAYSYCDANGLDISPESDGGAGPVDFKFSKGKHKVLVEIKLSTNKKVVSGYKTQLKAYEEAESTDRSHYVVIDVGEMGNMWKNLSELLAKRPKIAERRRIHLVDGKLKASASKLKVDDDEEDEDDG